MIQTSGFWWGPMRRLEMLTIRAVCAMVLAVVLGSSRELSAQLAYDRTTFLNGFASDSTIWTTGYYDLSSKTAPIYLGGSIALRTVGYPRVGPGLRYDQQVASVAPFFVAGTQHAVVTHSLGGLVARGIYVDSSRTRPSIAAIVTTVAPHQGTPLADNADEALRFFRDVQRRVNDAIVSIQISAGLVGFFSYFAPSARTFMMFLSYFIIANSGEYIELGDVANLARVPALPDLSPGSVAMQRLNANRDDAVLPRANIYGTIPFKNAVIRLQSSLRDEDRYFEQAVRDRNAGVAAFKTCKFLGYATIVFSRTGRRCSYARKVLRRVDDRWVKYVNGLDAYGRLRFVPFDAVVPNERSVYPSPNAISYDARVDGVNHLNIYKTRKGLNEVATAMARVGMELVSSPAPPAPLSISIDGPTQIQLGATCTWSAVPGNGSPPYSYQWTNQDVPVGNDYDYTGSKAVGSGGSSFRVRVVVTDGGGAQGDREVTVFEDSSAPICAM